MYYWHKLEHNQSAFLVLQLSFLIPYLMMTRFYKIHLFYLSYIKYKRHIGI